MRHSCSSHPPSQLGNKAGAARAATRKPQTPSTLDAGSAGWALNPRRWAARLAPSLDAPPDTCKSRAVTSERHAWGPSWPVNARRPPPAAEKTHGIPLDVGAWSVDGGTGSGAPKYPNLQNAVVRSDPILPPSRSGIWEAVGLPFHSRPHHLTLVPLQTRGPARPGTSGRPSPPPPNTPEFRKSGDWLAACGREDPGRREPFASALVDLNQQCVTQPPGG